MSNDLTKPSSPTDLAHQLFEAALLRYKGNAGEALMQVIRLLTEALVFSISVSAGDNEVARKGLLKHVGESIITAPRHSLVGAPPTPPAPPSKP
jgi:hypothetical protein